MKNIINTIKDFVMRNKRVSRDKKIKKSRAKNTIKKDVSIPIPPPIDDETPIETENKVIKPEDILNIPPMDIEIPIEPEKPVEIIDQPESEIIELEPVISEQPEEILNIPLDIEIPIKPEKPVEIIDQPENEIVDTDLESEIIPDNLQLPEKPVHINIFDQKPIIIEGDGIQESLKTIKKLNELNIVIGSPTFLNLGQDFTTKFERLKLLKEVSKSQSTVGNNIYKGLDAELFNFLENKFKVKESDPVEGNIRNILQQIADDQKVDIYDAALMVKSGIIIFLLSKGGVVVRKNEKIVTLNCKKMAGKSELLSENNIVSAFKKDGYELNVNITSFSYIIKLNKNKNEITCSLYKDGKFAKPKSLQEWLNTNK